MTDARSLPKQEQLRLRNEAMVILRKTNNFSVTARELGVSRAAVYKWRDQYAKTRSLSQKSRGGKRPHPFEVLSKEQSQELRQLIFTKSPSDVGLKGQLWSWKTVSSLIEQQFTKRLKRNRIINYLRKMDIFPTVPEKGWRYRYVRDTNESLDAHAKRTGRQLYLFGKIYRSSERMILYSISRDGHVYFKTYPSEPFVEQVKAFLTLLQKNAHKRILIYTSALNVYMLREWRKNGDSLEKICIWGEPQRHDRNYWRYRRKFNLSLFIHEQKSK
ncbi:MAG: hypothetical protein BWY02_02605 [bacterium ADurb.Bin157]|nr:MAG: hypothetical protein BWY02_02605 [bacterium ADurb.Bin157]